MAYLVGQSPQDVIHLLYHHRFGRLSTAVDTVISDAAVSRIHMVIEYQHAEWVILDVSRNGLWINDQKVRQHERHPLKKGDVISLGETRALCFTVEDDSPPADLLCQRDGPGQALNKAIPLQTITPVIDDQGNPAVIRLTEEGWLFESSEYHQYLLNFDWLMLREHADDAVSANWQINLADIAEHTAPLPEPESVSIRLILRKPNEAYPASAQLIVNDQTHDLEVRNHHDILLLLALHLYADIQEKREIEESGWVYMDEIVEKLNISEKLINIQIHRLRKQIEPVLANITDTKSLIMRRRGQLRVGFTKIEAYIKNEQILSVDI